MEEISNGEPLTASLTFKWLKPELIRKIREFDNSFAEGLLCLLVYEARCKGEEKERHVAEVYHLQSRLDAHTPYDMTARKESDAGEEATPGSNKSRTQALDDESGLVQQRTTAHPREALLPLSLKSTSRSETPRRKFRPIAPYLWPGVTIDDSCPNCRSLEERLEKKMMENVKLHEKIENDATKWRSFSVIATQNYKATQDPQPYKYGNTAPEGAEKLVNVSRLQRESVMREFSCTRRNFLQEQKRKEEVVQNVKTLSAISKRRLARIESLETKRRVAHESTVLEVKFLKSQVVSLQAGMKNQIEHIRRQSSDDRAQAIKDRARADEAMNAARITREEAEFSNWTWSTMFEELLAKSGAAIRNSRRRRDEFPAQAKSLAKAERYLQFLAPVFKMSAKVRTRFWASGKPNIDGRDAMCEVGDRAAYDGDLETDMALLGSGFI
ncbi:hypothetical protein VTL71DRAFT_8811 [Oculimacula yallundae]|uniref:Uncharacterized protein n=1 Tax=Oculimacula yallundae TaxID=86028 RepID=A0ABR4D0X4_9HELO